MKVQVEIEPTSSGYGWRVIVNGTEMDSGWSDSRAIALRQANFCADWRRKQPPPEAPSDG